MVAMQQKLAVASVLMLTLLAGMSVVVIQSHAFNSGQASPNSAGQALTGGTGNQSSSSGGSLLVNGNQTHSSSFGDDGQEIENESELGTPTGFDT